MWNVGSQEDIGWDVSSRFFVWLQDELYSLLDPVIAQYEKKLSLLKGRYLSFGGHSTMLKSVLGSLRCISYLVSNARRMLLTELRKFRGTSYRTPSITKSINWSVGTYISKKKKNEIKKKGKALLSLTRLAWRPSLLLGLCQSLEKKSFHQIAFRNSAFYYQAFLGVNYFFWT